MFDWSLVLRLFIFPGLVGLGVSWLATPLVIKLANKFGLVDDPKVHKHEKVVHEYPVPRGGGIGIFVALLVGVWIFLPIDRHMLGILLGAVVVLIVGLIDDRWDISPYVRLLGGNLLAALVVVASGIGIAFLTNPFGLSLGAEMVDLSKLKLTFNLLGEVRSIWLWADVFAVLWIVGLMNVVGMGAGGIDGQFPGVVVVAGIVIGLLSLGFSADIAQWPVITLAGITAGAYLGFLPWNFYPQKIMPGYSGKSLGGFLLAVMAILSTAKVGTALVVLGVPLVDVGWAILRRIAKKKSPVWGDRGHLHHKLLDAGWGKQRIAVFYWCVTALLGILALMTGGKQKVFLLIGLVVVVGIVLLVVGRSVRKRRKSFDYTHLLEKY